MALITCTDVAFAYEGTPVISGLNFSVNRGDYLCIVGENGSGKSTLMKGLLRLKSPSSGSLRIDEGLQANEIGYLPQQTPIQKDFPASVWEVVLSGRQNKQGLRPFYRKEDKRVALDNLERLKIANLKNRCYRELSGGQQQRVLLARALCATDVALLLDEPVAGLDPVVTQELYALIRTLNREAGLTILMVSHDVQAAVQDATHILHLRGQQLFFGPTEAYLATPWAAYLLGGAAGA